MGSDFCVTRTSRRTVLKAGVAGITLAVAGGYTPVAAQDNKWKITLIQGVKADNFYISMACGAQAAADELGATLDVQAPDKFDATLQTPLLAAVIQSKPDAILIAPNDRVAMIAPIQDAINAGIAVLTVDTKIESDIAVANIASDNVLGGQMAADALAKLIGEKGSVYVQNTTPGVSTVDQRVQGFEEGIKKYPNITYVGIDYNNDDPTTAASQTAAKLQATPDLAGIFGTNLFSAEGAATAVKEAGKTGVIKIVGFDAGPQQVKDLRDSVVDVLIAQHPYDIGNTGVKMAVDYLNTKEAPEQKVVTTGYTVVTRDNVDQDDVKRYLYVGDCSEIPAIPATPTA
ncbi:MAG TPA: ABC transporter substrate-binding protein [Thermomicrobiales bacterium]|nr:ABC transporter substrate-binding protein [Thermomicrobiales bacterium]